MKKTCKRKRILNSKLKESIDKARNTGFFHIMMSSVLKNVLAFIAGLVLVRVISKNNYGIYTYANNTLAYFQLFSGLGITSAVMQVCSEKRKGKDIPLDIYNYGATCGIAINTVLALIILLYSLFYKGNIQGMEQYLIWMSFMPLINIIFELATIYFRCKSENASYAYANLIVAICSCLFITIGSRLFDVWGLIVANYLSVFSGIVFLSHWKKWKIQIRLKIDNKTRNDLWKLSITSMAANSISSIMYLIDISVLGLLLKDALEIASYKVASTIPSALYFLTSTIVVYVYPYFAEHRDDVKWTRNRAIKLMLCSFGLFGIICLVLFVFANPIITIVFGKQYYDAISVFRILIISFFFKGTLRGIFGNLLVTQREIMFNLVESILTCIVNIVGDFILVNSFGALGVAFATLIDMVFSSALVTIYYFYVLAKKEKRAKLKSL